MNFRVNMGLDYFKDSVFEQNKEIELLQKQADFISSIMSSMVERDAEGNETPYFDFDFEKCTEYIHMRNPRAKIFPISAKTGEGMEAVADWLKEEVRNWKGE